MQLQRRRPPPQSSLWKQLEQPAHRELLEMLLRTYGAEALLSIVLGLIRKEKSAGTRMGFGCFWYLLLFSSWFVLGSFGLHLNVIIPLLMVLFSPIVLVSLSVQSHNRAPYRSNLLRLLKLSARELTDNTKVPELIQAIRSVGIMEDWPLRRELRQDLGRLLLRCPVEQAQKLTWLERLYLRAWLWGGDEVGSVRRHRVLSGGLAYSGRCAGSVGVATCLALRPLAP